MRVAEVVGRVLAAHGVRHVFGVVGSGNFHVTNALVAAGARFVPAAHEGGAASMADGYARTSGSVGVLSVHQGPGVTNALTGITEAAKSHTPMLVLAPEATAPRSNFFVDLPGAAAAFGADFHRVRAEHVADDVSAAFDAASRGATVLLALPLDVQGTSVPPWSRPAESGPAESGPAESRPPEPRPGESEVGLDVEPLFEALRVARRPVFIAGRGARAAREQLIRLADDCSALLAVSAAAKGLFAGDPWYLDVSGGFATPLAAELIAEADLVVAWGSNLNMWTTRHGKLISASASVVRVDREPTGADANPSLAANPKVDGPDRIDGLDRIDGPDRIDGLDRIDGPDRIDVSIQGDAGRVADATRELFARDAGGRGPVGTQRTPELRRRIAEQGRWRDVPYSDDSTGGADGRIDPRTLSIALDDMLPAERTIAVDSGNFMGYPSMFMSVPDVTGFCFTQAFQSIGLGLGSALGAAVARPDRLTIAALGDGGFLMSAAELVTAVRLRLPLLVVVYNDAAYGAEVHHFGPDGHPLDLVRFPDTDLGAIARGYGCAALTVRAVGDLAPVSDWLAGPRTAPLVVDAKVTGERGSWWLEEAFRGH